ncbi:uncharacterized protein LOC104900595 [Beta vulgaris subsp. vulgaris]|uniref:uncharacterized protein LOC104900595 n=1 Tax=Beta vulgaris subsp. vulgaris TaxID=3555 RepID=UPI00203701E5|nr:uncharacterized protein LOC104900595 [Beta vulgaris subsp. vulgaris]
MAITLTLSSHPPPSLSSLLLNPLHLVSRRSSYSYKRRQPQIQQKPTSPLFITRAMRAVVQRVTSATVEVEGRIVSEIGPGLLVFIGILESDCDSDSNYICRKVLNMRLFPNENTGKAWDQSVVQKSYEVLLVSQFTLYGTLKGNKPDFHVAMPPQRAKPFYESLVEKFGKSYNPTLIKDGVFGAMMKVNLVNDGPVTLQLESPQTSKSENDTEQP